MITEQQVVVTSVLVCLVGLIAFTIGLWTGHGREREYVDQLEEELGQLMALGGIPPKVPRPTPGWASSETGERLLSPVDGDEGAEPWPVHVDQALAVARQETVLVPSVVIPPDPEASVTGWTKAMAADMDRFIAGLISATDEQLRRITR